TASGGSRASMSGPSAASPAAWPFRLTRSARGSDLRSREIAMRLYDDSDSGNSYKVRLVLAQLGIPYELVPIDIEKGESRTAAFLAKNPNGRVPVLELDDGRYLAESNAILCHLAESTALMPASAFDRALALQWLFFEQYNHEPNVATARHWLRHGHLTPAREWAFAQKRLAGYAALGVMEGHLAKADFFV